MKSCKNRLSTLIVSAAVTESEDPFGSFSSALLNMHNHYCMDDHTSKWCTHEKVCGAKLHLS